MPRKKKTESKRKRVPFGGFRTRLSVPERKGYVRRWFNDQDDRIQRALDAGYQFVKDDIDVGEGELHEDNSDLNQYVSKIVSKGELANPIRAYLMEIPKEYYDEDQEAKEEVNKRIDDAIRSGTPGGATVGNSYVPASGIRVDHK